MALGAHMARSGNAGFSHIWVNDYEKDACKTFIHNFPILPEHVICKDVRELDFDSLPQIDGLVFGFPCNDFSFVGDDEVYHRHLNIKLKRGAGWA